MLIDRIHGVFKSLMPHNSAEDGEKLSKKSSEMKMRSTYRRPYTLEQQEEFNKKCAENINKYWDEFGLKAEARVEKKRVFVSIAGQNGRHMWSEEIVSSVSQFPAIKRQVLGLVNK